jgi:hypothetical protein
MIGQNDFSRRASSKQCRSSTKTRKGILLKRCAGCPILLLVADLISNGCRTLDDENDTFAIRDTIMEGLKQLFDDMIEKDILQVSYHNFGHSRASS